MKKSYSCFLFFCCCCCFVVVVVVRGGIMFVYFLLGLLKEDCFLSFYMEKFPSLCLIFQILFFVRRDWWKVIV